MSRPGAALKAILTGFPRPRGDEPMQSHMCYTNYEVFPARAGMSLRRARGRQSSPRFPRPRGDEPLTPGNASLDAMFSPPMQG